MINKKYTVRSGDYCKCNACGYEGYAYGTAHAKGISAPFCKRCGVNSKLEIIKEKPSKEEYKILKCRDKWIGRVFLLLFIVAVLLHFLEEYFLIR